MQQQDFLKLADETAEKVKALFTRKNTAYGADADLFFNFRNTAARIFPDLPVHDAMFRTAETYVDKHNVALAKGINVSEAEERLLDRIVYSLLQLAMVREYTVKKEGEHEEQNMVLH